LCFSRTNDEEEPDPAGLHYITADGPYNKTGYRLEHREDGFAITVGLMEYISGWSALEILYWLHEKQAIPRRYDNARRQ
jgi:hypothetical protein